MDELNTQFSALSSNLTQRLENLERRFANVEPAGSSVVAEGQESSITGNTDIHAAFAAIKSALSSHRLPTSLIVPTDKTGVRKADQPTHNVITKVAKYIETIVKLIQVPELTSEQRLGDILTVASALTYVLQEEAAALVVQGTFDDGVAKFFRSLQRGHSFSDEALANLRAAASIAAVYRPQQAQRGASFRGGGHRGHRGGFRRRGFSRGGFHSGQGSQPSQDDTA